MRRRSVTLVAALLVLPLAAHAQGFTAGTIDAVVSKYQSSISGWEPKLQTFAEATFGILAMISLAWALIRQALNSADGSSMLATLMNQIFFIGFWFWVLSTTTTWGPAIINSFRQAASSATGAGVMRPGDVFNAGWNIASKVVAQMSLWSPAASVGLLLAAIIVMVVFALICASMVLTLIQSYFIIGAGVILIAFAGSSFTSDVAISVIRQTLAIGMKLFAQIAIVAIGMDVLTNAVNNFGDINGQAILALIGVSIVLAVLQHALPNTVERMVGGAGFAGASELVGVAGTAAGAAVTGGRAVASGAAAAAGGATAVARWGSGGSFHGRAPSISSQFTSSL